MLFSPYYVRCLLTFLGLLVGVVSAQSQSVIRQYESKDYVLEVSLWSKEDGLPSWHIFDIIKDKRGFMWLGTDVGLVRFDGHSFITYAGKDYGLRSNRVGRIAQDAAGNIWLFCSHEDNRLIDVFDPIETVAIPLKSYINEDVPLSTYSHYGLFRQKDTIWLLDPVSGQGGRYTDEWEWLLEDTTTTIALQTLGKTEDFPFYYPRKDGLFWVWKNKADRSGLYVIDRYGNEVSDLNFTEQGSRFFSLDEHLNFYHWPQPQYAGDFHPLLYFDEQSIQASPAGNYRPVNWGNSFYHDHGRFLKVNKEGVGLSVNNAASFFFKGEEILFEDVNSLLARDFQARINEIIVLIDSESFWFNSPEGLFRMKIEKKLFTTYTHQDNTITSVRGMVGVGDSQLIANTYAGMFRIDLREEQFSRLSIPDSYDNMGLLKEGNQLWVGKSAANLVRYDLVTERYREFPFQVYQKDYNGYSLHRLNDTVLWVASSFGVLAFNEKTTAFQPHLLPDTSTYYWHTNDRGLWLGSQYGLLLFDTQGKRKEYFPIIGGSKSGPRVYYIHEDKDGLFWLGTDQGLISWHPDNGNYRKYTVADGLSNETIHAIFEDNNGYLWLSSNYGLMHFRKSDGYVTTYLEKDGLPNNEFNFLAYFQRDDGLLFLGGVNGIISFYPDSVGQYQERAPRLELATIALYDRNTERAFNQTREALENGVVTILPTFNRLEVSLVPHYLAHSEMVYEWRMPEENDQWKPMSEPRLMFNNPAYGEYLLEMRAYPLGNRSMESNILVLKLRILKPIYLRWWFIALFLLLLIAVILVDLKNRQRRLKLQNEALQKEVGKQTQNLQEQLATIDRQTQELKVIDELKSQFFINVSHELRTPLSLIVGPAAKLAEGSLSPQQSSHVQRIKRNALQLQQLIEEILELAHLEVGKIEIKEEEVTLVTFFRRLYSTYAELAKSRDMAYTLDLQIPTDLSANLDVKKVERILDNLIFNAFKFTHNEGQIIILARQKQAQLVITVEDTGVGISPADIPRIFDRYYQGRHNQPQEHGGFGLGLAISKELAQLLKGTLTVKSKLGQGSRFTLSLPLFVVDRPINQNQLRREQEVSGASRDALPALSATKEDRRPCLLIVEDNEDLLDYLTEMLADKYRVAQARNGREGLEILNQTEVDLVVSDVMMPRMNGFELLKEVRSQPQQWGIPFILLTARAKQSDQLYGLRLGVDAYLSKPFSEEELLARIDNLLRNQAKRKAAYYQSLALVALPDNPPKHKVEFSEGLSFDELWLIELEALLRKTIKNTNLKVGDLANSMAMSERSFRDKLKQCTGLKPNQYILQARLQLAHQLLEEKRYPTVAMLAYAVGFRSKAYFSKTFKAKFGKTPSEVLKG